MKSTNNRQVLITSALALFSMFFGAGNMIFPPTLGRWAGDAYLVSMVGFLLTSVGIVMLAVSSTTLAGGGVEDNAKPLGKGLSTVFGLAIMLSIGPGLAIPRTAATTHELLSLSLGRELSPVLISALFFILVLFFTFNSGKVISILGNILTPVLLVTLSIIIIVSIVNPIGQVVDTGALNVFARSFEEGYQTMDGLAAFAFSSIIIQGFRDAGITKPESQAKLTVQAGLIAGIFLAFIYGGLLYAGATSSSFDLGEVGRVDLLVFISRSLIGNAGVTIMSIAMILACLTTATGLSASVGNFFERISGGRISYRIAVIVSILFSFVVAIAGVESIVAISGPILAFIYPIAIVMIFLNLARQDKNLPVFYGGVAGAFVYSVLVALGLIASEGIYSFLWIIFALVGIVLFTIIDRVKN